MDNILLSYVMTVDLLTPFIQKFPSGGINTPPAARILLMALALLIDAKDVLETGYDAGNTTLALAMSGAYVTAIDDGSEYPGAKNYAKDLLKNTPNALLITGDALEYMREAPEACFDMIFIDDNHALEHVTLETVEVMRILRPGGLVAYHDVNINYIGEMLDDKLDGWRNLGDLRCWSEHAQENFGIGIYQKPY